MYDFYDFDVSPIEKVTCIDSLNTSLSACIVIFRTPCIDGNSDETYWLLV